METHTEADSLLGLLTQCPEESGFGRVSNGDVIAGVLRKWRLRRRWVQTILRRDQHMERRGGRKKEQKEKSN